MKQHPFLRHLIQVRRLGYFAPVTTKVIPRNIVGDEEDEVGLLAFQSGKQEYGTEENVESVHF